MAAQMKEYNEGNTIDFGDKVRVERHAAHTKRVPAIDPKTNKPKVTLTGKPDHDVVPHLDEQGEPVVDDKGELVYHWSLYQLVENKPHEEHEGKFVQSHHGFPTDDTHTWVFVEESADKAALIAKAKKLAG